MAAELENNIKNPKLRKASDRKMAAPAGGASIAEAAALSANRMQASRTATAQASTVPRPVPQEQAPANFGAKVTYKNAK